MKRNFTPITRFLAALAWLELAFLCTVGALQLESGFPFSMALESIVAPLLILGIGFGLSYFVRPLFRLMMRVLRRVYPAADAVTRLSLPSIATLMVVFAGLPFFANAQVCTCNGNLLTNPGFETSDFTGWTLETNDPGQTSFAGDNTYAACGTRYAYFNPTAGNATDYVLYYQQVAATPGNTYSLSVYSGVHDPSKDHQIRLAFYNASNVLLGSGSDVEQVDNDVDLAGSPATSLIQYNLSGVAPVGTAFVRVTAYVMGAYTSESISLKVDAFCLTTAAAPVCALTPADLTINSTAFGPGSAPLAENVTINGSFPLSENNIAGFNMTSSAGAFYSFCVEINQPLLPLQNPYTHELNNAPNGFTPAIALRIAQVIQAAGFDNAMGFGPGNNTVTNFVALQMAVWNAFYDTDYTISAGNFQMLTDNNPGVRAVANAWLTAAQAITAPTVVVHRLHNASGQDLLKIGNVPANVTVAVTQPTCNGANSPNNGVITIGNFTNQRYQYSTGVAFNSGSAIPASITAIPVGGVIVSNLANTSQNYTVRIYDATDDNCYVDQTVTITEVICGCINPTGITFTQTPATCTGTNTPANNGAITLVTANNGTHYGRSTLNAVSYNGPTTVAGATAISLPQTIASSIPNTGGTYIVRIFNAADDCYTDQTVTAPTISCTCPVLPCAGTTVTKN